ncbi:hypothetical protein GCM10009654_63060 [Streptomyces hebeiensis]|uniref:Uncharacterized protein n=1 Tax=Streptomyces hebeiensis TaxID=229486 RepID=A0ABN1V9U2_9ACTN
MAAGATAARRVPDRPDRPDPRGAPCVRMSGAAVPPAPQGASAPRVVRITVPFSPVCVRIYACGTGRAAVDVAALLPSRGTVLRRGAGGRNTAPGHNSLIVMGS